MKKGLFVFLCSLTALALLGTSLALTLFNPQFRPVKIMRLMQDGRRAMSETDFAEAIDCFRLVLHLDNGRVEAYLRLADIYVMEDDPEEALYYVEQGLKVKPESEELLAAYETLQGMIAILYPPEEEDEEEDEEDEDSYTPLRPVQTPEPTPEATPAETAEEESGGETIGGETAEGDISPNPEENPDASPEETQPGVTEPPAGA